MAANSLLKSGIAKQLVISHLPPPSHSTLSGVYLKPEQVGLFIWDVLLKVGLVIVLRTTAVLQYHLCPEVDVWVMCSGLVASVHTRLGQACTYHQMRTNITTAVSSSEPTAECIRKRFQNKIDSDVQFEKGK